MFFFFFPNDYSTFFVSAAPHYDFIGYTIEPNSTEFILNEKEQTVASVGPCGGGSCLS